MKNLLVVENDGTNIYATLNVKASRIGIWILSTMIVLAIIGIITLGFNVGSEELEATFFAGLFIIVFFIILPIRYLLWNLYGKELLIINTKSISYSYDYGWFKTNLTTIPFHKLGTSLELVQDQGDGQLGKLTLWNYRETDNVPELIHETTVLIDLKTIYQINEIISEIFKKEKFEDLRFIPFSDN